MLLQTSNSVDCVALVALYGSPHQETYEASSKTYFTAQHLGDSGLRIIDIKTINSVVMMAPDDGYKSWVHDGSEVNRWYLMQMPGLKVLQRAGVVEHTSEE